MDHLGGTMDRPAMDHLGAEGKRIHNRIKERPPVPPVLGADMMEAVYRQRQIDELSLSSDSDGASDGSPSPPLSPAAGSGSRSNVSGASKLAAFRADQNRVVKMAEAGSKSTDTNQEVEEEWVEFTDAAGFLDAVCMKKPCTGFKKSGWTKSSTCKVCGAMDAPTCTAAVAAWDVKFQQMLADSGGE